MQFPEYPFEPHYVSRPAGRLHYLDEGPTSVGTGRDSVAPPVVMLHGNPNWSFYYRRLITELAATHRCLALDHLGCGLSDKPSASAYRYRLQDRIDDLGAWLDNVVPNGPITLVVHDWGGMIGSAWAVANPDRIAKLVILNTGAFPNPKSNVLPWQLALARTPLIGDILIRGASAFSKGAVKSCVTRTPMPPEVAAAYCAPHNSWANRIAVHRFVLDIPLSPRDESWSIVANTSENLNRLASKPTLIGWGDKDFVFDDAFLREWIHRFPGALVYQYADCGHYILEDAPELLPVIAKFIRNS